MRRTWVGTIRNIRRALTHQYTGNTCTGSENMVRMVVSVTDGPQTGREIEIWMTPDEAERQAQALIDRAKEARQADF